MLTHFFGYQLPHQSSDSERTQSKDRGGDFMDTTMDSSNLLLLACLSSYVFAAADGISITGNVANSSMVHTETSLVIEEVADGGATRGGVTDPLLPPKGIACAGVARESIISEPTMPTSDLGPPKSRKITGTASATHASIIFKDLCLACLIKKNFLFVSLTNRLAPPILFDSCRRRAIK